jgi:hypothetical protein
MEKFIIIVKILTLILFLSVKKRVCLLILKIYFTKYLSITIKQNRLGLIKKKYDELRDKKSNITIKGSILKKMKLEKIKKIDLIKIIYIYNLIQIKI